MEQLLNAELREAFDEFDKVIIRRMEHATTKPDLPLQL